jgi:hypothetical protein
VNKVKRITVVVLAVSLLMLFSTLAPAFAKNFNYPEGQDISYFSGGVGFIATPTGYFGPIVTSMRIRANDVEIGTGGSGDHIEIDLGFNMAGNLVYLPVAFFITNPNPAITDWLKVILSGFPAASLEGNIRYVPDDVLIVNRHGNSITVELTAPQTITMMIGGAPQSKVVPVFTVELNKVGGSYHHVETGTLPSGWTGYTEAMGFYAEGAFTCSAWSYNRASMTDCYIVMHGSTLYTPPASPP